MILKNDWLPWHGAIKMIGCHGSAIKMIGCGAMAAPIIKINVYLYLYVKLKLVRPLVSLMVMTMVSWS